MSDRVRSRRKVATVSRVTVKPLKQVRFDDLVKASGNPEAVTLWAKPGPDSEFTRSVERNQVVTVVQRNIGAKKDYGVIGFETLPNATFLLFPKALPYAAGTKVIGIKYERLAESAPRGALYTAATPPKRQPRKADPVRGVIIDEEAAPAKELEKPVVAPKEPKLRRFRAVLEITAKQQIELEVTAASASEAHRKLKQKADDVALEPKKAAIARKLSNPKQV